MPIESIWHLDNGVNGTGTLKSIEWALPKNDAEETDNLAFMPTEEAKLIPPPQLQKLLPRSLGRK